MDITCPIRIDVMNDSEEEVASKWKMIKQWYKDHPEASPPWERTQLASKSLFSTIGQKSSFRNALDERLLTPVKRLAKEPSEEVILHITVLKRGE